MLSCLVFVLGAFMIKASALYVAAAFASGILVSVTIVGLAVGLGAFFADFAWEHTGQLVASFGSLIFMLISIAFISIEMSAVGVALFIRKPGMMGAGMSDSAYFALLALLALVIYGTLTLSLRVIFRMGERSLVQS
jgi:hypothetical protein